jgi:tetratricopeptide (TPR) repeat protein
MMLGLDSNLIQLDKVGLLFFINVLIVFAAVINKMDKIDIIFESAIFTTLICDLVEKTEVKLKDFIIFILFVILSTHLTMLYLGYNNLKIVDSVVSLWIAIYLAMLVYRNFDKEKIMTRKFALSFIILSFTIYQLIKNPTNLTVVSAETILLVIATYNTIESIGNYYSEYRSNVLEGSKFFFALMFFKQENFADYFIKHKMEYDYDMLKEDMILLFGISAICKQEPQYEIAKRCLDLIQNKTNISMKYKHISYYYLGLYYMSPELDDYSPYKAYDCFNNTKMLQEDKTFDGITYSDIDLFIAGALLKYDEPDYNKILKLLNKCDVNFIQKTYYLGKCYYFLNNYNEAEKYLLTIECSNEFFDDIPYMLLVIQLSKDKFDYSLVKSLYYDAKGRGYNVDDVICEYNSKDEKNLLML